MERGEKEEEERKPRSKTKPKRKPKSQPRPWASLPGKQNVVRCPPINWAQYAVVGESLDKLHREQQARPVQGQPAVLAAAAPTADHQQQALSFEFRGAADPGTQEPYLGVAAPYDPLRDRVERKKPGPRRGASSKR